MSYILDSLKKSDAERKKLQQQSCTPYSPYFGHTLLLKKRRIIPGLVITTFFLLATVILGTGWWYANKQETEQEIQSTNARVEQTQKPESVESTTDEPATSVETEIKVTRNENANEQISPALTNKETPPPSVSNDEVRIPILSELPFSTISMLPEMKFRGHAYSPAPNQRMIMINAAVAREGDLIAPDLTLKEITENGVILSYRETAFQIRLF